MADRPGTRSDGGPRRVLWLTKGLGRGGTERLLVDSVRHVDPGRFEVEVAYVLPWKDALVGDLEAQGVAVHCLWPDGRRPQVRWVRSLRRLVHGGGFDLVHTHMPLASVAARLALGRGGPPVVHTEHNLWPRYRRATRWANALTYHRNAAVMAVSEAVAGSIHPPIRRGPPVHVVRQGIDPDAMARGADARCRARHRLGLAEGAEVVGTVGNLTAKKDHRCLLRAAAALRTTHPDLRVVVIGSGPLEPHLRRAVADLGLDGCAVLTGSRGDVPELLAAFDVFALSSRHEGLPIALLEAMAAGLPCVATRVGGVPEVITDGVDGVLVEPGDDAALAAAADRLLADGAARATIGERARRTAGRFDLAAAVERTQGIYEEVLCRR